ncbi:MAG: ABC transporter [Pseudonocardiales bacterium]|nr:MAG: ABC transporter [Pseudonocardiales bacterium]
MNPAASGSHAGIVTSRTHSLWRLRTYVRPYRWQLMAMTAAAMLASVAQIAVPLLTKRIVDGPIAHGQRGEVLPLGLLALLFGVAEAVLVFLRRWGSQNSSLGVETDIRRDLYRHLQRLPIAFHDRWQSGQLLSRATSDLSTIRRFIGFGLVFLVVNAATFVLVAAMLIVVYPLLGILVAVSAIPLMWVLLKLERRYKVQARRVQDQQGEIATAVEESAQGIRVVKAFGRRQLVYDRFDHQATRLQRDAVAKVHTLALLWAIAELHPQIVLAVIVLVGSIAVAHGVLTLGTMIAFVSLFLLLIWPIESMGYLLANAQEALSAADRFYELLDAPVTISDTDGAIAPVSPAGRVVFENVGFCYPDSTTKVLHDVNLAIEPGETVALVGAVGTGKSTLTGLVTRLYDVTSGRITIDGVDIRDMPMATLRTIVATAFEEPILFSASARENLTLGRPDATDDEVRQALEIAQAEFVDDLPWGLDTRLGEQGLTLSGGQRQRVALARAIVGHPRVLVLDDPLSALDVATEALVEEALRRVLAGTTGLVVAHRPSTVLLADRAALLSGGTIVATGTHHELLETVPAYRAILSQEVGSDIDPGVDSGVDSDVGVAR